MRHRKFLTLVGALALASTGVPAVADEQPLDDSLWALDRIDQREVKRDLKYHYEKTGGAGVTVYILDSGVRSTHQDFEGRVGEGADFITPVPGDPGYCADDGHGTSSASLVGGKTYGVAKAVTLVPVRVLNCAGYDEGSSVPDGIDWVTQNAKRPAIINLSLGDNRINKKWDEAVERAVAHGITVTVAAGNDGEDACSTSPGDVPGVLTVGATDDEDRRWDNGPGAASAQGKCIDLFAPGAFVIAAGSDSDIASGGGAGTSASAPLVAGAAALYLSTHPNAAPVEVANHLLRTSTKDAISDVGDGSPNRLLYVGPEG